ncbi:pesticidal protein Cry7Aa [bacterium 336/3]|nr:pesticidal protein Cry7Aa [bacterium 336/3]
MVKVKREGIILEKTENEFENNAVFNPAVWQDGENVHIFYRAVRKGNFSTIGYCLLKGPLEIVKRNDEPLIVPEFEYESHGIEDPRIVKIDDIFYLTYTAYDKVNALGALALSKDLVNFKKQGLISPQLTYNKFKELAKVKGNISDKYFRYCLSYEKRDSLDQKLLLWDKNVMFFPRRIKNKLLFLHRIRPGIQLVVIDKLEDLTESFWMNYFINMANHIVMNPVYRHEASYIGAGCPPIETKEGWLLIYHGVEDTPEGYIYHTCAALLDLENPLKEISRLKMPLFSPKNLWEQKGIVDNVVFPTGTSIFKDRLYIYYGAADEFIAVASMNMNELLDALLNNKPLSS